jgi:prephenate dehydrogenase/3-phosphoshikimate 1-carboxyvinyltransferase
VSQHFRVGPSATVEGQIHVPGDKSVSHRALMLGAIAEGTSHVTGFLPGEDCLATLAAVRAMGVEVVQRDSTTIDVFGHGMHGLRATSTSLDMGNSGTAMRLLMGMLAPQAFSTELFGDESLSRRPMERVAKPLRQMGADIQTTDGKPPVRIRGGKALQGIQFHMPVASAQVKSAVLLAGLYAGGETSVVEPAVTRDHTERMLLRLGWAVRRSGATVTVAGGGKLTGGQIPVPGDLSSAAFMILAGCIAQRGELVVDRVGLNPTRTGILRILELMGADLRIELNPGEAGEPVGRLIVRPSALRGVEIPPELVPLAIDEFPVIFLAAALASGETVVRGAEELRHKETDRIRVMADGLRALGVSVDELADGARIRGGQLHGGTVDSGGDHRVAMAFAVGAARAAGPVTILDTANVATSYPGFVAQARAIGLDVEAAGDD